MSELPFQPECYFCEEAETEEPEPVIGATFKSGDDGFLCQQHFERAQALDQLVATRLVMTGVENIIKRYDEAWGL